MIERGEKKNPVWTFAPLPISGRSLARPTGLEPVTGGLEDRCSYSTELRTRNHQVIRLPDADEFRIVRRFRRMAVNVKASIVADFLVSAFCLGEVAASPIDIIEKRL